MTEQMITITSTGNSTDFTTGSWITYTGSISPTSNELYFQPQFDIDYITLYPGKLEKREEYLPGEQMEFDFVRQMETSVII